MKSVLIIYTTVMMLGFGSSAFAMHSNVGVDAQEQSAKCGYQTIALDPNRQIARCY